MNSRAETPFGKLPEGVEINGKRIRISFTYKGVRCRETLKVVSKINNAAITYANSKRQTIVTEIKEGRFDYLAHFPDSPRAAKLSGVEQPTVERTVHAGVHSWLAVQRAKKAASTSRNYGHKARHVLDHFTDEQMISDITKGQLELFQASLLRKGLAAKTVNDIFTVVRGVWADAFSDGVIRVNPLDRIKNIEHDEQDDSADPFTRSELGKIERAPWDRLHDLNMALFACWAGLSVSELLGVGWDDIDIEAGTCRVRRSRVESVYKVPKEKSRDRTIELIAPARDYLRRQWPLTGSRPATAVEVVQRDNISVKLEEVRFVFLNETTGEPWSYQGFARWFGLLLDAAGVRRRGPNQCRHTFASQAVSSYVPLEWVARQLGHTDTTMVKKHYGRWIPTDMRSMADMISGMMGFEEARDGQ